MFQEEPVAHSPPASHFLNPPEAIIPTDLRIFQPMGYPILEQPSGAYGNVLPADTMPTSAMVDPDGQPRFSSIHLEVPPSADPPDHPQTPRGNLAVPSAANPLDSLAVFSAANSLGGLVKAPLVCALAHTPRRAALDPRHPRLCVVRLP